MIKKGNLLKPSQLHNEQNQQKFNIKATRPSPTCWEELKLVLDNELPQNKKASQISNIKNTNMHNKSNSSNSNNSAQNNNNNNFKKNNEKNQSSKKKSTILYIPQHLSKINASCNLFGYFNGPISLNDDKIKSKSKNIDLIIEVSFEFHLENECKVILALDENKLCHFSSPFIDSQPSEQDQSQAKNQNQNLYYQMQWNPYYSNMISHSNSYPKVQFVPIVQGYAIYPQQNQQYQQQVLNIPQVNQIPPANAMSTANIQENDEK